MAARILDVASIVALSLALATWAGITGCIALAAVTDSGWCAR